MKSRLGFSIIELMTVVILIGVLAAIALPSYQYAVRKSRRSEAHHGLIKMQLEQENYRMLNVVYADDFGSGINDVKAHSASYYQIEITDDSATTYTLTAKAITDKPQAGDTGCTEITLNQNGDKTPSQCW
ncbi:MAG: prepilin-type N-terminal cleavage/methylation domain-containing protein [Gammaproteobacteria bacterium]|nr:prepilin-type N-terminal cleavage/methylation domain-containing protein [Gammaproteobacteria bacterium]